LWLVKLEDDQVTFRYKEHNSKKTKYRTLPAEKFIHHFLQHVLPNGFIKVRYYGLFSPGNRPLLRQARQLLAVSETTLPLEASEPSVQPEQAQAAIAIDPATTEPSLPCPTCGRSMQWVGRLQPQRGRSPP